MIYMLALMMDSIYSCNHILIPHFIKIQMREYFRNSRNAGIAKFEIQDKEHFLKYIFNSIRNTLLLHTFIFSKMV